MTWYGFAKLGIASAMVAATITLASGCGDGIAISRRERQEQHHRIFENDMKQLSDDWDFFWLNDAPSKMSNWRIR